MVVKYVFTDVIDGLDMHQTQKTLMYTMAEHYEINLPDSLYLNHYELSEEYGFTPSLWSQFLKIKEIDRLIEAEIAQIAEIGARDALKRLSSGTALSADIQAAKELLANSKLLKQKVNQRQQIIITRIPHKETAVMNNG